MPARASCARLRSQKTVTLDNIVCFQQFTASCPITLRKCCHIHSKENYICYFIVLKHTTHHSRKYLISTFLLYYVPSSFYCIQISMSTEYFYPNTPFPFKFHIILCEPTNVGEHRKISTNKPFFKIKVLAEKWKMEHLIKYLSLP